MKLAESWIEDAPELTKLGAFHDDVEEVDEVDEAEDGCAGVAWQSYVLTKVNTSNKMLHELAREVRGVEKRRGKKLTVARYKTICGKWEDVSRPFLQEGHDYFTEFLAKLDCVTVPKGETLQAAFERAKRGEPPAKVLVIHNEGVRLLASLCRELQEMGGDQPIMLHQTSILPHVRPKFPLMKITIQLVLLVVLLGSMALTGCCTLTKSDRAKTIAASI
jgi:hypothetical protein